MQGLIQLLSKRGGGGGSHQSKVGVHIRHTITKGVGHALQEKNNFW